MCSCYNHPEFPCLLYGRTRMFESFIMGELKCRLLEIQKKVCPKTKPTEAMRRNIVSGTDGEIKIDEGHLPILCLMMEPIRTRIHPLLSSDHLDLIMVFRTQTMYMVTCGKHKNFEPHFSYTAQSHYTRDHNEWHKNTHRGALQQIPPATRTWPRLEHWACMAKL